MNISSKIWTDVGAYVLLGAAVVSPVVMANESLAIEIEERSDPTYSIPTAPAISAMLIAQGGEGGEGETPGTEKKPEFQNKVSGAELVKALRQGGHIVYFRHAQTEVDYADQVFARMGHCATQRMLSEEGWKQARAIGKGFKDLQIPVGKVYSSEFCRAWQTADLAFGRFEKSASLNFPPAEEYTDAQKKQMKDAVMPFLTAVPASGMNTVIVGHDDVFDAATGIYPEPQGIAYVLRPDGKGGFEILASVKPEEWSTLAR
jgi:phosphohistidine phosphatase SixA